MRSFRDFKRNLILVTLTILALTLENVIKSYREGAAYFLPKEEMVNITSFVNDILKAKIEGKSTWDNWVNRLAGLRERTFGYK